MARRGKKAWVPCTLETELESIKEELKLKGRWRKEAYSELVYRAKIGGGLIKNDFLGMIPKRKRRK